MTDRLTIAVAQLDPTVGDIDGNIAKLRRARAEAERLGADLVVASEMVVAGYPADDLVLKPSFVAACQAAPALPQEQQECGGLFRLPS